MHQTFSQRSAGMTSEAETRPLLSCEAPGEMLNCSEAMKLMLYHVTVATFKISPNFINSTHNLFSHNLLPHSQLGLVVKLNAYIKKKILGLIP